MMKSLQLAYKKKTSKTNPEIWKPERLCLNYTKFNLKWVVDPQGLKPLAFCEGGWRSVQSLDLRTVETTFIAASGLAILLTACCILETITESGFGATCSVT